VRRIRGVQRARRHVFAFDGCCGTATSQTLFHLATNRYARVIGCDRDKPEKWVRKHIPLEFQKRFVFISKDMADVTPELLDTVMREAWGVGVDKLSHFHDSHPCTTLSRAERRGIHRYPDGSPKSWQAKADDRLLELTIGLIHGVLARAPGCLVTIENPWGPWLTKLPVVIDLLATPGWSLLLGSYCMCANELDGSRQWPQKHTYIISFNLPPSFELPICRAPF
jgi:hypothetical protein